jgi:N4-gp56 family major capsid protein
MPGTQTTTTHASQIRTYFERTLLAHAIHNLVLQQLANRKPLPPQEGSKTITFFKPQAASSADVQTLTEGTPIAVFTDQVYTTVVVTLAQFGESMKWSDILTATALLKVVNDGITRMGENVALKCDDVIMAALSHATTGFTKRYSGGAATYAALSALSNANGKFTGDDALDGLTALRIAMAPRIKGEYIGVAGPQVLRDLMKDTTWVNAKVYSDVQDLYNGEAGSFMNIRFLMTDNPWGENATEGTRDTATPIIWSTYFVGADCFGVSDLGSQSPYSPKFMICDTADKSDPGNQFQTATVKTYYGAVVLQPTFGITVRSRTVYA